jgi:hypothetical protein
VKPQSKPYVFLKWLFGLLVLAAALGKLLDNVGFAKVITTYQFGLAENILLPLALTISLLELLLAGYILREINPKRAGILLIAMHLGYTLLAIISNLRGLDIPNCGCFGVFYGRPMTWQTVVEDAALTALSYYFYRVAPTRTK